jgi:hypothetical protein
MTIPPSDGAFCPTASKPTMTTHWTREPLVHFLAMGALLFLLFGAFGDAGPADDEIVVTPQRVTQLAQRFAMQWQRPPTREELDNLIESYVREEVLYREALAMGLEQDDTVIRRRLVQKLEFLSETLVPDPSDDTLRAFLGENPERYEVPASYTFQQVYFSPDRRGGRVEDDARAALAALRAGRVGDVESLGDGFLLPRQFTRVSGTEVAGLFGSDFAAALSDLEIGSWQGPVLSGYGLHLVRVDEAVPARPALFDEIRNRLETDYMTEQRRQTEEEVYQELRERYVIDIQLPEELATAQERAR